MAFEMLTYQGLPIVVDNTLRPEQMYIIPRREMYARFTVSWEDIQAARQPLALVHPQVDEGL